jgi:hypothetical protein
MSPKKLLKISNKISELKFGPWDFIGLWNLEFQWNLKFGIWILIKCNFIAYIPSHNKSGYLDYWINDYPGI